MYTTLDDRQIVLLWRVRQADYVKPFEFHDFATLMGKDLETLPDDWLAETYERCIELGLLHEASRATNGAYRGRLAARARWLLDDLNDDAA
jgi:hypothetical protein